MNTSTLESFISYCDDMMIAEEGIFNIKSEMKDAVSKFKKNYGTKQGVPQPKQPGRAAGEPIRFTHKKASGKIFDYLVKHEALCAEGLKNANNKESCQFMIKSLSKWADSESKDLPKEMHFYYCTGRDVNTYYHLTGDNRYSDSISFFFLDWSNWNSQPPKYRFRWFSDVVDNNARREILKGNPHYKEYHSIYGDEWFNKTVEEARNR